MVAAIRLVLEQHGFRAGRHRIGYRSCDDATAQSGGTDVHRCFSNAEAYARDLDVVGVVGPFFSFCAQFQIPIANEAPDGPLAMIGPTTTVTGLTRPWRGMDPGELERLYPTGARNFVRVAAADHLAAVALVKAADQLRRRRVFTLWDADDPDTAAYAADMRATARRLGIRTVGASRVEPRRAGLRRACAPHRGGGAGCRADDRCCSAARRAVPPRPARATRATASP